MDFFSSKDNIRNQNKVIEAIGAMEKLDVQTQPCSHHAHTSIF